MKGGGRGEEDEKRWGIHLSSYSSFLPPLSSPPHPNPSSSSSSFPLQRHTYQFLRELSVELYFQVFAPPHPSLPAPPSPQLTFCSLKPLPDVRVLISWVQSFGGVLSFSCGKGLHLYIYIYIYSKHTPCFFAKVSKL